MAWLANLLGRTPPVEVEESEVPLPPEPQRPPLMLLLSDASGTAALRMMTFDDAAAASKYIEFWYPKRRTGTLYAIWALPDQPAAEWISEAEIRGEAMILIRDEKHDGVVYSFSFSDFETAWDFVRHEMRGGLDPRSVLIHWVVPVALEVDAGGAVKLWPDEPPPARWAAVAQLPDENVDASSDAPAPVLDLPLIVEEANATPAVPDIEEIPIAIETGDEKFGKPYHEMSADAAQPEIPPAQPRRVAANGNGDAISRQSKKKPSKAGQPKTKHRRTVATIGNERSANERRAAVPDYYQLANELARLLEARRFERKDEPFKGFNSPPGRF